MDLSVLSVLVRRYAAGCNPREVAWVVFGQIFVAGGIFLNVIALTRLLTPQEYGVVALGLAIAAVFQQALWGALGNAMNRFYATSLEQESSRCLMRAGLRFAKRIVMLSLAVASVSFLMSQLFVIDWLGTIPISTLLSIGVGYTATLDGVQNAARRRSVSTLHQTFGQLCRLGVACGLVIFVRATGMMVLVGYSVASALTSVSATLLARSISTKSPPRTWAPAMDWNQRIWGFAWPIVGWGILSSIQNGSDRWSLELAGHSEAVGLYGAIHQIGYYPVLLIGTAVSQLVMPVLFEIAGDGSDRERLRRSVRLAVVLCRITLVVSLFGALVALVVHRQVFSVVFAEQYRSVSDLWPLSVAAGGLFVAGQFVAMIPMSFAKSELLLVPFAGTAFAGIVFNAAGASIAGIPGVSLGVLLTSLLYFIGPVTAARRLLRQHLHSQPACQPEPAAALVSPANVDKSDA